MLFLSNACEDVDAFTIRPDFSLEVTAGVSPVRGVDEAGRPHHRPRRRRGVILSPDCVPEGIDDSKRLAANRRTKLASHLKVCADICIGVASVEEIDDLNILGATMLAMRRAI